MVPCPYSIQSVLDYIVDQYEAYLREETSTVRSLCDYSDTRVHVCIYMVSPHAHGYARTHAVDHVQHNYYCLIRKKIIAHACGRERQCHKSQWLRERRYTLPQSIGHVYQLTSPLESANALQNRQRTSRCASVSKIGYRAACVFPHKSRMAHHSRNCHHCVLTHCATHTQAAPAGHLRAQGSDRSRQRCPCHQQGGHDDQG
jgi:hypothetical protein